MSDPGHECCEELGRTNTWNIETKIKLRGLYMVYMDNCHTSAKLTFVTSRALMHMLILLLSLCCLLEEILATCYMKFSGATVVLVRHYTENHDGCLYLDKLKGTSRGLKALQSNMNDSYHKSVLY